MVFIYALTTRQHERAYMINCTPIAIKLLAHTQGSVQGGYARFDLFLQPSLQIYRWNNTNHTLLTLDFPDKKKKKLKLKTASALPITGSTDYLQYSASDVGTDNNSVISVFKKLKTRGHKKMWAIIIFFGELLFIYVRRLYISYYYYTLLV